MVDTSLTKTDFDTLLDTTFDEIKKLDIPNVFDFDDEQENS